MPKDKIDGGHAAQGHGEVCLSAIEASLKGEVQVILHKGKRITWPRGETPTHYMTMRLHSDLDEATKMAAFGDADVIVIEEFWGTTSNLRRSDPVVASALPAVVFVFLCLAAAGRGACNFGIRDSTLV